MNTANASCPTCNTEFEGLPFEIDEDGGFAVLEVRPCFDPRCGKLLCAACSTFECDGCGELFCTSHAVIVPDGTPKALTCCAPCAAEFEPFEMPERIGPQFAPCAVPARTVEVA